MKKMMKKSVEENNESSSTSPPWHNLPLELLQIIFAYLPILDQLSFRRVCKFWYMCSSFEFDNLESRRPQSPWFMFVEHRYNRAIKLTGEFSEAFTGRVYKMRDHIPDLFNQNTRVLKSTHGWFLVLHEKNVELRNFFVPGTVRVHSEDSSLFFLNPFTRARIDLPPLLGLASYYAESKPPRCAVSGPPTAKDCVIVVIYPLPGYLSLSVNTCRRGDCCWTTKIYDLGYDCSRMMMDVVYSKGFFYCVRKDGWFLAFNVSNNMCVHYGFPDGLPEKRFYIISYLIHQPQTGKDFVCLAYRDSEHDSSSAGDSNVEYSRWLVELPDSFDRQKKCFQLFASPIAAAGNIIYEANKDHPLYLSPTYESIRDIHSSSSNSSSSSSNTAVVQLESFSSYSWMSSYNHNTEDSSNTNNQVDEHCKKPNIYFWATSEMESVKKQVFHASRFIIWIEPTWISPSSPALTWY